MAYFTLKYRGWVLYLGSCAQLEHLVLMTSLQVEMAIQCKYITLKTVNWGAPLNNAAVVI
jgi:hypothetical protein